MPYTSTFSQYSLADNLNSLMESKGVSNYRLAKDLGVSDSVIGYWRTGHSQPSYKNVMKLAQYFGISASQLTGIPDVVDGPSVLRSAPAYGDKELTVIAGNAVYGSIDTSVDMHGMFLRRSDLNEIHVFRLKDDPRFMLRVHGTEYEPLIFDNELLLVEMVDDVNDSDLVVTIHDGTRVSVRRCHSIGKLFVLRHPLGRPDVPDLMFTDDANSMVRILGKITNALRTF